MHLKEELQELQLKQTDTDQKISHLSQGHQMDVVGKFRAVDMQLEEQKKNLTQAPQLARKRGSGCFLLAN